jgi:glutamine amidotransferase
MRVSIMDYGVGNLYSIAKGLERSGADVEIVTDPGALARSEAIVFPGVGAFGAAMDVLRPVREELRRAVAEGVPTLGICLGMQILFESSEESPGTGLGVFGGRVTKIVSGRVPQMGWNDVESSDDPLFDGIPQGSKFYYANSYICQPTERVAVAETKYGQRFAAAVRKNALCGVQFHPEKSGPPGLRLLRNFVVLAEGNQ